MSFLMGPRVTELEWKKHVIPHLVSNGLNIRERNRIEGMFQGTIKGEGTHKGIDPHEMHNTLDWMKKNMSKHNVPQKHIDVLESALDKYMYNRSSFGTPEHGAHGTSHDFHSTGHDIHGSGSDSHGSTHGGPLHGLFS